MKINSIDFKVVTQSCYFPKDNTSSQAAHHGPRRSSHLPFGQGARVELAWVARKVQSGHVAGGKERRQGQVQSRGIRSSSSVKRWYGFHAFQLGHSGFFHSLEIPRNCPRGKKTNAGSKTENHVHLYDPKDRGKKKATTHIGISDYHKARKHNTFLGTFWQ